MSTHGENIYTHWEDHIHSWVDRVYSWREHIDSLWGDNVYEVGKTIFSHWTRLHVGETTSLPWVKIISTIGGTMSTHCETISNNLVVGERPRPLIVWKETVCSLTACHLLVGKGSHPWLFVFTPCAGANTVSGPGITDELTKRAAPSPLRVLRHCFDCPLHCLGSQPYQQLPQLSWMPYTATPQAQGRDTSSRL